MSTLHPQLLSKLNKAWLARAEQDLFEVIDLMSELKAELGLPLARFDAAFPLTTFEQSLANLDQQCQAMVIETLILWASVLRAQKDLSSSKKVLEFARRLSQFVKGDYRTRLISKLSQEEGINAYISSDFTTALEFFMTQLRYQASPLDGWYASMNALLCFEALGLPQDKALARAREALSNADHVENSSELAAPLLDYERRRAFWDGHLQELFKATFFPSSYSCYVRLWMQSLPWHRDHKPVSSQPDLLNQMVGRHSAMHLQDFRLRTLQGLLHPDDLMQMPAVELAQRAYIWTWRWLVDPDEFDIQRVIKTISAAKLQDPNCPLPPPQALMMKNALRWIALFDLQHASKLEKWAQSIVPAGCICPVFQWEGLLISYLKAFYDGNTIELKDIVELLTSGMGIAHRGDGTVREEIFFIDMIKAIDSEEHKNSLLTAAPWLKVFVSNCLKRPRAGDGGRGGGGSSIPNAAPDNLARDNLARDKVHLLVDLRKHILKTDRQQVVSRHLAAAASILFEKRELSRQDFLHEVFGILSYDALIHDSKIMNLLARLRPLVGTGVKIGVKEDFVYSTGDWTGVDFLGSFSHVKKMNQLRSPDFNRALEGNREERVGSAKSAKAKIVAHVLENNSKRLTRKDLESILGTPRSTTNRIIERLVSQRTLASRGDGPSRYYEFSDHANRMVP
ncbi:MAG: hypothetical protein NTV34_19465 [Proteobacteria bacterium]|nr:hypothetical protein [Pseudomonadota bacterium]